MKGSINGAFVHEGHSSKIEKKESGFELKEMRSDIHRQLGITTDENERIHESDKYWIPKYVSKFRTSVTKCLYADNLTGKIIWFVAINGLAVALLVASIIHYTNRGSPTINWCQENGFLWILYAIVYLGFVYYGIKKLLKKRLSSVFKKASEQCEVISSYRGFRFVCYVVPVVLVAVYVIVFPGKSGRRIVSFLGTIVFIVIGAVFSKYPTKIRWRTVFSGVFLQLLVGALAINWESGRNVLECLSNKVDTFLSYSETGSNFVYGFLSKPQVDTGFIFAFSVLPVMFFLSFFLNILSYYGILQWFIVRIGWLVRIVMGTTVCESVNAAASIFLGMAEAPLLIKSYLKDLTESELCSILCAGWSTVAGVVLAAYIKFGVKASHLISASIMSAPASLSVSKLFYPETKVSKNDLEDLVLEKEEATNALDAATKGAMAAISIVFGVIANIIAILSFISFIDGILGWLGLCVGFEELSTKTIMSKIFVPVSFLIGVETESLEDVAYLIGIKTVANEFQAYEKLGEWIDQHRLSKRSEILATYALCGFSNFGSIGISIGALGAIEPTQRSSLTKVAFRAFVAANIVCFMTACIAGCLIE